MQISREEFAALFEPWPADMPYAGSLQALAGQVMLDIERAETSATAALAGTVALLRGLGAGESESGTALAAIVTRLHRSLDKAHRNALDDGGDIR